MVIPAALAPTQPVGAAPAAPGINSALRADVLTATGVHITSARATVERRNDGWRATLRRIDRPGQLASAYFAGGLRDVVLALEDGRTARARITASRFLTGAERVFEVEGREPLL